MKILAKIVLVIAIFFAGFYVGGQPALSPSNGSDKAVEQGTSQVSVMFDYGDGTLTTVKNIDITSTSTVFDVLKHVTAEEKIDFKYKEYGDLGVMVDSIGDKTNNFAADQYWQFWVNNAYSTAGASLYRLKAGDVIEWKYIKGQFTE